jgi:hypothetical protein
MLHSAPAGLRAVTPAGRSAAFLAGVTPRDADAPSVAWHRRGCSPVSSRRGRGLRLASVGSSDRWLLAEGSGQTPGSVQATTPGLVARPGVVARSEVDAVPDVPARAAASLVVSRLINAPRQMRLAGRGT